MKHCCPASKKSTACRSKRVHPFFAVLIAFILCSCSGGQRPPTVTIAPASPFTANVPIGQTAIFIATVAGTADPRVVWQVNGVPGGNSTLGTIDASGTASGLVAAYTAPAVIPIPPTVTVSAVSQSDPMLKGSLAVRIGPLVLISPAVASVQTYGTAQLSASVTGIPDQVVTWQVTCKAGGSACGAISQAGLYKAPNSVPTTIGNNLRIPDKAIVTATSQAEPEFSGSAPVFITSLNQQRQSAPIKLGTSGSNGDDFCVSNNFGFCTAGTLTALLARGGKQYVLSNNHILAFTSNATIGDPIVQPGLLDTGCEISLTTTVANLSQFFDLQTAGSPVDAAIAEVTPGAVDSTGAIIGLGDMVVGGVPQPGAPAQGSGVAASPNQTVAKSGRTTGVTCSTVEAVSVSLQVNFETVCPSSTFSRRFSNLVTVGGAGFSAAGDSGSLIVEADTARPVALLFAGSTTTALAIPVSTVLNALKDANNNVPTFVGGAPHVVAACSLPPPSAAVPLRATQAVSAEAITAAEQVKNRRGHELLADPNIAAIGVGESLDAPGQAAIIVFVQSGAPDIRMPPELEGVRTRIIQSKTFPARALLNHEETDELISQVGAEQAEVLPQVILQTAVAVKEKHAAQLMANPAIQGVGVSASLDDPGKAALIVYMLHGHPHDLIPVVLGGVRTRIKETPGFHAGASKLSDGRPCPAAPRAKTATK